MWGYNLPIMIRFLVVAILLLVILGLLGVSVQHDVVENPGVQENTSYVESGVVTFWNQYLANPASYLWNDIFVNILWTTFVANMDRLRNGEAPVYFQGQTQGVIPSIPDYIDDYNEAHPANP